MNRHLDKCLSEPKADGDEDEVPSVSDPRMVQATVDEDELSEGWKDFCDSTDEERPEEPLPEKENVSSLDSSPTGSQASTSGLNHGDDDLLAQPLPLESPLEGAARMKTKASRYGGIKKYHFPTHFLYTALLSNKITLKGCGS